ncbi:DUF6114 domain-containing protein [Micromonospora sp. URMC 105]|uniref:DUF6114 domain-containing protein n=1 Tax=Micromonospora sp. URMC 105 TaxID=3423413 RepID=UPI003F1CE0EF
MRGTKPQRDARRRSPREAWRGFRRWQQKRPYWGGLLTALAGLQIFGTTQMSLEGLSFQLGPTGFLSWLVPAVLVTSGLLIWFSPQHRVFYAVIAAVTALFALIGVNLGGFFVGTLIGLFGSSLAAGWVPAAAPTVDDSAGDRPVGREGGPDDSTADRTASPEPQVSGGTPVPRTIRLRPAGGPGPGTDVG